MTILEAVKKRHSVRSYISRKIPEDIRQELSAAIDACNKEGGLHMQLVTDDADAFNTFLAHYGKFHNVQNYIALVGPKAADLDERIGYYGEKIVLFAQALGLNTCWVALTYSKGKAALRLDKGEKLCLVIAIGYGQTGGVPHKSKERARVMDVQGTPPDWFIRGIDAALLAPTAMNQQKFVFSLKDNVVTAKPGLGFYSKVDLGIAKYHFELGAGTENFRWG